MVVIRSKGVYTSEEDKTLAQMENPTDGANQTTILDQSNLITDHRQILDLMTPVLDDAQSVSHSYKTTKSITIIKRMKAARDKCGQMIFPRILFRVYVPVFQTTEKSLYVENLLDFIHVTCLTLDNEEQLESKTNTFSHVVLRCCTKHHSDFRAAVRLNITHLAVKLLGSYPSIERFDQKLLEKVKEMFMHRVRDKNAQVRVYGAIGLKHFQTAGDRSKCPVTKALVFLGQHDPNPEVRRTALKSLEFNEETKELLIGRVTDVSELVRLSAQTNIASKIPMDSFTLDEREKILQAGLTDTSGKVRKRAALVVESWLKTCNDDVIAFLSKLDVVTNKKVCYLALNQIFKEATTDDFKKVNLPINENDKLIPMKTLNEEVVFFWKYVVGKFRKVAYCAELILPSTHDMCGYLLKYFATYEEEFSESHGASVLEHLLQILVFASEICEEGGRREIIDFIRMAFDFRYLDVKHVKVLMELFYKLQIENVDQAFFELIQNMLATSRTSVEAEKVVIPIDERGVEDRSVELTETETMTLKMELGTALHEKHKAIREKDLALLDNDYMKAHNIQMQINDLGDKAESLRLSLKLLNEGNSPVRRLTQSEQHLNMPESQTESQREDIAPKPSDYFPAALEIAFSAFLEHIQRQGKVSDTAHLFCETFIVTSIVNDSEEVRELVIKCMGVAGLANSDDAKKAMLISIQALLYDFDRIRIAAYRSIFDLLLHYGFDHFDDNKIQRVAGERSRNVSMNNSLLEEGGTRLKLHVMDQLNSTNQDLVRIGATGLIKLTLANRISSAKIVSRLLVMWSNPVYENSELVRDLSMWLPLFAKIGAEQAFQIADSLVPTMRKLIYAGRQSPLSDASPEKLVSFVASSTTAESLRRSMKAPEAVQERMINYVLNEMATLGPCGELSIFGKALKFFSVRGLEAKMLEALLKKLTRLMHMGLNKSVMQSLKAFHKYLNAEFVVVTGKQVDADDTGSPDEAESSDSEESVRISEGSAGEDDEEAANGDA